MKNCENCSLPHLGIFGSGRFCSMKCSRSFSTKDKRAEINKKVSEKLTTGNGSRGGILLKDFVCENCQQLYTTNKISSKYCSKTCKGKSIIFSEETRLKMSIITKKRCENIEERLRLRDIGRKGGFGKKGYTESGIFYQSGLEKLCFEYLESLELIFETHKYLPNSSKISDVFIPELNLWIEIDGINREKRKEWLKENYTYWLEKIDEYRDKNLNLLIDISLDELKEKLSKLL